jgi:DNA-binding MurR/RpiR family transcriptional regulator
MPIRPPSSFLSRVRQNLVDFHPKERLLAEFVLDFPGDLPSYTASELALLAGVSNATVTRFIKRLGYQDYEDARLQVREERLTGSPLLLASRNAAVEHPFSAGLERSLDNLRRTFGRLNAAGLDEIAQSLLSARKLWVCGMRSSQSFASYFRWQMFQLKEETHLFPHAGDTLGQYTASIVPEDMVVVFALRRRPASLAGLVQQVLATGAQVLYISDQAVSRQEGVHWHVYCACDSDSPLDDHVAVTGICHVLSSRVMELCGAAERERLTAIEANHDALQEL